MFGPPAGVVSDFSVFALSLKVTVRIETSPLRVIVNVTGLSFFGRWRSPPDDPDRFGS